MTAVQKAVAPYLFKGNDVIGCAQTGSGKTLSYLLPIINNMLQYGPPDDSGLKEGVSAPVSLILVPTRELAEQVYKEARKILYNTGINIVKIYGGVPQGFQKR